MFFQPPNALNLGAGARSISAASPERNRAKRNSISGIKTSIRIEALSCITDEFRVFLVVQLISAAIELCAGSATCHSISEPSLRTSSYEEMGGEK